MKKVFGAFGTAYLEYALRGDGVLIACSLFERSAQQVKSVTATLCSGGSITVRGEDGERFFSANVGWGEKADSFVTPMRIGKERVCHALVVSKKLGKSGVLTTKKRFEKDLYNFLMTRYKLPLLPEWTMAIYERLKGERYSFIEGLQIEKGFDCDMFIPLGNEKVNIEDLIYLEVNLSDEKFEEIISELLQKRVIRISEKAQSPLHIADMDQYFSEYGSGVIDNLTKLLHPVSEHTDWMEYEALKGLRLYPQQISVCSGVINYFRKKKGRYAFLNCGMGTGKTIMGATVVDGYFNAQQMSKENLTLKEVLENPNAVKYRNIVMCPPHLVEKWVSEIKNQIPHAKVESITSFSQLLELKAAGRERHSKEWYVMSKDFGKLSYMEMPAVKTRAKRTVYEMRCNECKGEKSLGTIGNACTSDGCEGVYVPQDAERGKEVGFTCPECGLLLCTPQRRVGDGYKHTLGDFDFIEKNRYNERCYNCNSPLWQPYVRNLGEETKSRKWRRITHYANKAKKGKKTVWLLDGTVNKYIRTFEYEMLNDLGNEGGCRKYAPASYIKKQLKGFFDFAVFDEVHQYKGGGSAQGMAMHSLIKASRFQLALTGTIAGGYATDMFHLLFRLEPKRMLARGFNHNSEIPFAEQYGIIESVFEAKESFRSNKMSKGKQVASPKVKPGISPKIFTDFLMDRAVFLDLSDMSRFLPPLKEKVVLVDTEEEIISEYTRVTQTLRDKSKEKSGFGLMSSMLQFSLSYCDKPYGVGPIIHPVTGQKVVTPGDLSYLVDGNLLLNKERELVSIVNKELEENRNMVIFCEYTNSEETCITERLMEILEKHCGLYGQVQIIKSSSPAAIKREEWLHEKAAEGVRVFITNPKILETGVDLCFKHKGVEYNYPTICFYQMGYSLYTLWQASRRHFRLNQREECRTYYMASAGTVQPAVIKLIAAKQVATAAIQGKFSAEGLSAMAEGVDTRLVLAKALADGDTEHQDELQGMFDVLADSSDEADSDYVPMSTYYELVGEEEPLMAPPVVPDIAESLFGELVFGGMMDLFNLDLTKTIVAPSVKSTEPKEEDLTEGDTSSRKGVAFAQSMSLFDFI